jgi:hypothetical protein
MESNELINDGGKPLADFLDYIINSQQGMDT